MPRRTKLSASPRDAGITRQYGKIGIAAVAAAARYQPNDKSSKPFKLKDSGGPRPRSEKIAERNVSTADLIVMRALLIVPIMALIPSVGITPASAGSCAHIGPTRELICVCKRNYCWLEVGTRLRFNMRFDNARALTDAGAIGVWSTRRN